VYVKREGIVVCGWVGVGREEKGVSLRVQWLTLHHKTESVLRQRKPSHAREEKEGGTLPLLDIADITTSIINIAYSEEWISFKIFH